MGIFLSHEDPNAPSESSNISALGTGMGSTLFIGIAALNFQMIDLSLDSLNCINYEIP